MEGQSGLEGSTPGGGCWIALYGNMQGGPWRAKIGALIIALAAIAAVLIGYCVNCPDLDPFTHNAGRHCGGSESPGGSGPVCLVMAADRPPSMIDAPLAAGSEINPDMAHRQFPAGAVRRLPVRQIRTGAEYRSWLTVAQNLEFGLTPLID